MQNRISHLVQDIESAVKAINKLVQKIEEPISVADDIDSLTMDITIAVDSITSLVNEIENKL